MAKRLLRIPLHVTAVAIFLLLWQWASDSGALDPTFFGSPTGIWHYLVDGFIVTGKLWLELAYTVAGTLLSFFIGSAAAILSGLVFTTAPAVERALAPYISFLNAIPRIALAPLFLLWFGLGLGSKLAVGVSLTFFIVLSSTVAGIRGVSADHLTLSRTLGASGWQLFLKVTLPSAVPVLFSGLRLGLIFAMLGVVGAEIIAAEHGIGQQLAYLQSTFNMNGVMGILVLMAGIGIVITGGMSWLERLLLRWQ